MLLTPRIPLIDTARGLALVAMASYHFTWDLEFFGYVEAGTATTGAWKIYARLIATSFLFLVGVSLVLAHRPAIRWSSYRKRMGMVAAAAALISLGTYIALPQEWIFFGILHNIAVSSLLGLAFLPLPPIITAATAAIIGIGFVVDGWLVPDLLRSAVFNTKWLAWLGFAEAMPRSNDFVPLFPWFSAVLAGIAAGGWLQRSNGLHRLAQWQTRPNLLTKAGQHSLIFYLVHQPVLIALVYLASLVIPPPAADPVASFTRSCEISCTAGRHEAGLCQRFCACTADRLIAQSLFTPMQSGQIDPQTDQRVLDITNECTAVGMAP
ncbi:DUF1624 domain-containing protein [Rhizobium sp. SSA_523]|uniref:DUF1624 domain-containing protein n=1 Tax=Rhizobium sp. SSA_523 TaxID=2952477 RepID=UPI0020915226|nr:DUF1624 domain-containing protein [Rhizobium sp. SSA_523]MCO5733844.1 DUF1624 domain-containing protein [Rhizobium sp. SSA_523]WKC25895.1 DUF1624 domain-containing protein [Rhizobium sp. SSA_523]